MKVCNIGSGCDDPAEVLGMCRRHYQYVHRWMGAGPKRAFEHRERLAQRQACLDAVSMKVAPNVHSIKKLKRRRAA